MKAPTNWAKRVAASLGVRITRQSEPNRFQAVDTCLLRMKRLGYRPRVVIDGGANVGQFFRLVDPVFPEARYHLIEPQPSCAAPLLELAARQPERIVFHPVAITGPGVQSLRMTGCKSTGAYVAKDDEPFETEVRATSLDALFRHSLREEDHAFLKLDLESHEYEALCGASGILPVVEVVLIEVAFYDINDWGRPVFADVFSILREAGFELYDIVSLASRLRDQRLRMGDVVFVRTKTALVTDNALE